MARSFLNERYLPMYEAGLGGTSRIFASFDTVRRELVAVKRIFPEIYPQLKKKESELLEELSLRNIEHPHVMGFIDRFWHEGSFCMVTEFIWGMNLEDYLYRRPLSETLFVRLADQLLAALGAIHGAGYLHGDVKPQNMMVHFCEAGEVSVKILDFGLADVLPEEVRFGKEDFMVEELFATPEYVAPELIRGGTPSELSDLYGLGQSFFHCLTGEAALVADTPEKTARMQVSTAPPSIMERRPDLPPELAVWVDRFLVKSPRNRWPTADAARTKLKQLFPSEVEEPVPA